MRKVLLRMMVVARQEVLKRTRPTRSAARDAGRKSRGPGQLRAREAQATRQAQPTVATNFLQLPSLLLTRGKSWARTLSTFVWIGVRLHAATFTRQLVLECSLLNPVGTL